MNGTVVVLGERNRVAGFALAGARVLVAEDPDAFRRHWRELAGDVVVVVLTSAAAAAVAGLPPVRRDLLSVVMP